MGKLRGRPTALQAFAEYAQMFADTEANQDALLGDAHAVKVCLPAPPSTQPPQPHRRVRTDIG